MPKSPNQTLIDQLMVEMEKQREIIRQSKEARRIIRELNRLIAVLGGEAPELEDDELPAPRRPGGLPPVVEPNGDGSYTCPECGRSGFSRPQGLGAHRKSAHGVKGADRAAS